MSQSPDTFLEVAEDLRPLFGELGMNAPIFFTHPEIQSWRKLPDRENCTWDVTSSLKLHIKRYSPSRKPMAAVQLELDGLAALEGSGIPTAQLAAWGRWGLRAFVATRDLTGFEAADKLIMRGMPFETLLVPTATMAAQLHTAGLHHRDLYLCHFMVKGTKPVELRLIDAARVRPLPAGFTRRRWIVKDLGEFWYSTLALPITDEQRDRWLATYAQLAPCGSVARMRQSILRKIRWIGAHDQSLRQKQPLRNISIPQG